MERGSLGNASDQPESLGSKNPTEDFRQRISEASKRRWQDPEFRRRTVEAIRAAWRDPEAKASYVARIHSPEAEKKRSAALAQFHKDNPHQLMDLAARASAFATARTEEDFRERFGAGIKEVLVDLATEKGMTLRAIGKRIKRHPLTVRHLIDRYGVQMNIGREMPEYDTLLERKNMIQDAIKREEFFTLTLGQQEALLALYFEGERFPAEKEVAAKFGCTKENVNELELKGLRSLGIITEEKRKKSR